ncbi:MAG TPA: hypothetical protein PKJ21_08845, partial [Anaerolineae bacterium]|nr:hypothetical protein [Anaerolineae bacterium]
MNSWKAYKLRQLQQKKPRPVFQWLSVLLLGLMLSGVLLVAAGAGGAFAVYAYYSQQLPSAEEFGKTAMSSFK